MSSSLSRSSTVSSGEEDILGFLEAIFITFSGLSSLFL
jgi:hypothetical protein